MEFMKIKIMKILIMKMKMKKEIKFCSCRILISRNPKSISRDFLRWWLTRLNKFS